MSELRLSWTFDTGEECLRVEVWQPPDLAVPPAGLAPHVALLPLDVVESGAALESLQPIAGAFSVDGDTLWFRPRYPFRDGVTYVLLDGLSEAGWRAPDARRSLIVHPARASAPSTVVSALHPDVSEVPLNLLKFYVEFSAPMSEGCAGRAIRIFRADDRTPLQDVFAPMDPELWDPGHRRLTVLLDPGRIKRGLVPNAERGYPLTEGDDITISIGGDFHDAAGQPLAAPFERTYHVGPAIRDRVLPTVWQLDPPAAGTREPLSVAFDRPLDHALLHRTLHVLKEDGSSIAGDGAPGRGDATWQFTPKENWAGGTYRLSANPILEDLAGNSLARLFDHDIESDDSTPAATTIDFHTR